MTSTESPVRFTFTGRDGTAITAYRWAPLGAPRGVVQLTHGMGEHLLRYDHLATTLAAAGFVVHGQDHRGHGATAGSVEALGAARRRRLEQPGRRHRRARGAHARADARRARRAARAQHGLVRRPAVPARPLRAGSRAWRCPARRRSTCWSPRSTSTAPIDLSAFNAPFPQPHRLRVAVPRRGPGRRLRRRRALRVRARRRGRQGDVRQGPRRGRSRAARGRAQGPAGAHHGRRAATR